MADKKQTQPARLTLATERIEFEIETTSGPQTLAWEIGPASMSGAWAREDYRTAALVSIQAGMEPVAEGEEGEEGTRTDWERMSQAQRRAWLFHLWTGATLAGATVSATLDGQPLATDPESLIALPQAILEAAVALAYKHNPAWRPGYDKEQDPN